MLLIAFLLSGIATKMVSLTARRGVKLFLAVSGVCIASTILNVYNNGVPLLVIPLTRTTVTQSWTYVGNNKFNCSQLNQLVIQRRAGGGTSRSTYLASYNDKQVAVKLGKNIDADCVRIFRNNIHADRGELLYKVKSHCKHTKTLQMLMEIIYHSILKSPYIIDNLGYCIYDNRNEFQEGETININRHARWILSHFISNITIISVYEYGQVVKPKDLGNMSLTDKLQMLRSMTLVMNTLTNTSVGPVAMVDFRARHVAKVNDTWKMYDLGLFEFGELPCGPHQSNYNNILNNLVGQAWLVKNGCPSGTSCVNGTCSGLIERLNSIIMCYFFRGVLSGFLMPINCFDRPAAYFQGYIDSMHVHQSN